MTTNTKSALMLSMLCASPVMAAEKPNLLFIVTDEHSFRTLGCYRDLMSQEQAEMWGPGNVVETPNLDRIADNGAIFSRMYASSAVSMPARATMFTGYYGFQLGMENNTSKVGDGKYLRADVPTIGQQLQKAGYATGYAGKIHLAETTDPAEFWEPYPVGHPDYHYGFDDCRYMFNGGHGKFLGIKDNGDPYFVRGLRVPAENGVDKYGFTTYKDAKTKGYIMGTTDFLAARTMDFIEENKDQPFYYTLSIPDPHTADYAVGKYHDMYTGMEVEYPRTFAKKGEINDADALVGPDGRVPDLNKALPQYFGMVKNIDDCVGKIIDKLEEEGVLENTIIVFTSDHGEMMGEHGRMNKGVAYEASSRVPFVICHGMNSKKTLIPRGQVVDYVANTADWMPTFLSLLDVECPEVMGRDIKVLIDGSKVPSSWRDLTFTTKRYVAAIEGHMKLYVSTEAKTPVMWLSNLELDPDEKINYIDDPKYRKVVVRLTKDLQGFDKKTNMKDKKLLAVYRDLLKKYSK